MASQSGGQENMIRVVMAIVDEFGDILRDVLQMQISSSQLIQIVNRSKIHLRPEQLNLVNSANVSGYADFDITLLYTLIRNLCTSIKPSQGWGYSKGPGRNDLSMGDDIERIRLIRNEVYGHVSSSFMMDSDFQKYWHEISNICKRMEQRLGRKYTAELAKIESCVIDKALEEKYKKHLETDKHMIEEMQVMQVTMSDVKSEIQSLKEMLQENQPVEQENQLYTRIVPKVSPILEEKVNLLLEIACDSLNAVVDTINENTSNQEMFEILEEILQIGLSLEDYQGDHSDKVIALLSQLKAKVKWYSTVNERHGRRVLLKFTQVTVKLMNLYKVKFRGIKGSMVLKLQFFNREGCQKYREDVENGNLYRLFSSALLYPTFLSLLGLEMADLDFSFENIDYENILTFEMEMEDPQAQDIINCDMCSSSVELYCNPCHVNLCGSCSPKHMRANPFKTHSVVLYRQRILEPVHPKCKSHSDQKSMMFCKTCKIPICIQCVTSVHKKHDFISTEEHIITSMKSIIEADTKELEDAIIPIYVGINSELEEKAENLHQEYDEVQKDIDRNGIKWHKKIDIVIQKHKTQALRKKEENLKTLKNYQTEMQDILSQARDVFKRNKDLLKTTDAAVLKNYKSRNEELRTVPRRITMTIPSFNPIQIQGKDLYRQFGDLKAALDSEIKEFKVKQPIKPEVDINVETKTEGIYGISYLPVDKTWIHGDENTIDLIDIQGTVLDTVKTLSGERPLGQTVNNNGHLIYGDYITGDINMVKNGQTCTIITLHGWAPYDMCFTLSDDLLIVIYAGPGYSECKVVRYDKDYNFVREMQYDDKGAPLYTAGNQLMFITENKNTDVCVANSNAKNVITVNQSGKLRWRYTGNLASYKNGSFTPAGIATDSQCHVLVGDFYNDCIHVINNNGQFILYIEDCDIKAPHCLCVDAEDRLFVGQSKDNGCKIAMIRYLK